MALRQIFVANLEVANHSKDENIVSVMKKDMVQFVSLMRLTGIKWNKSQIKL